MTPYPLDPNLDPCSCCEDRPEADRSNRPGLPAIPYRLGTYGTFLELLLAQMARPVISAGPTLEALKTRSLDDGAIALLDAWAVVADVLTFYQERIANENYLRTATERRSVLELARAIGYELNPGVAASTYLAFTVEGATNPHQTAIVAAGTQVQSIPTQDQLPQTFETATEFEAKAEWNALKPLLFQPQVLALEDGTLYWVGLDGSRTKTRQILFQGLNTRLKPGDLLLVAVARESGEMEVLVAPVTTVTPEPEQNQTRVELALDASTATPSGFVAVAAYTAFTPTAVPFTASTIQANVLQQSWREADLRAFVAINRWNTADLREYLTARPVQPPSPIEGNAGVFALRSRLGCFGNNAPAWASLPSNQRFGEYIRVDQDDFQAVPGAYQENWDDPGWQIWNSYPNNTSYGTDTNHQADVYLERTVDDITPGGWVVFELASASSRYTPYRIRSVSAASVTGFSLSARVTGLALARPAGEDLPDGEKEPAFKVRNTIAHAQSERLALKELSLDQPLEETRINPVGTAEIHGVSQLLLDRLVLGLQMGQPVALQGEQVDAPGVIRHEIAFLEDITHEQGLTRLWFTAPLQYRYLRHTVTLNANVVQATHGETVTEVLGNGDATLANQTFKLKKPPLTYVSADTPSGAASTLAVRVDSILWEATSAFYGLSPTDERYTVRIEDDGTTHVIFGDGQQGARLSTGMENVTAVYRSGIGLVGEVAADSLSLIKTRPLGIRSVTNPVAATGAEDPEQLDNARENAPLTVLTLDRIVSRQDYEDFARAFAGIGKAQAVSIWDGFTEQVHITIAGANGLPLEATARTYENLRNAILDLRDPGPRFQLASFVPRAFNLKGTIWQDDRYLADLILETVNTALLEAFAFPQRGFGQGVSAAEVITLIQSIAGVVAVDLDLFYRSDQGAAYQAFVEADPARWDAASQTIHLAELLLVNPAGIELEVKAS